jgi:translocator protein
VVKQLGKLLAWILVCELVGGVSSIFTISAIPTWYATLNKPFFNPPSWIFAPVWTTLYLLMGVAAYLYQKSSHLFTIQLALNFLWSYIFFDLKSPILAFVEIIFLWLFIFLTIKEFRKKSKTASLLLVPYLLWVSFASLLNLSVVILNP